MQVSSFKPKTVIIKPLSAHKFPSIALASEREHRCCFLQLGTGSPIGTRSGPPTGTVGVGVGVGTMERVEIKKFRAREEISTSGLRKVRFVGPSKIEITEHGWVVGFILHKQ